MTTAKLVLVFNDESIGEYPLDADRVVIGRRPGCEIHIDNLAVSGEHAAVSRLYNYHFLQDLGSTNGTFINGERIEKKVLTHNDRIQVGKHDLIYNNPDQSVQADFQKTIVMKGPAKDDEPEEEDTSARSSFDSAEPEGPSGPGLRFLDGPNAGKLLEISTASMTIGRQGSQLAVISRNPDGHYVKPGRGQAIVVNGKGVNGRQRLQDHDIIELDGTRMEFLKPGS